MKLPEQDFDRLRREGIAHIEQLGSALWTDYNTHDPGITLLETLCFAINDLGYRCASPMRDLLAPPPDASRAPAPSRETGLFSAREILTSAPVTVLDYRKLLVDVEGVKNAWLSETQTPCKPFYPNRKAGRLTFEPPSSGQDARPVVPRGVYDVVLELADHPTLGSLNDTTWPWTLTSTEGNESLELELVFLPWDEWRRAGDPMRLEEPVLDWEDSWLTGKVQALEVEKVTERWPLVANVLVRVRSSGEDTSRRFQVHIQSRTPGADPARARSLILAGLANPERDDNPIRAYRDRLRESFAVAKRAMERLQAHRNLCEDFHEPRAVRFEEIALCADVDIAPEADLELVQSQLLFTAARLLAPPVRFHTLAELLDRGMEVERIFEGPPLEHGFLLDEELEPSGMREEVHGSDFIGAFMELESVVAIRSFVMAAFGPKGEVRASGEPWTLTLPPGHLPRLAVDRCRLVFYKQGFPFIANAEEARHKLEFLTRKEGMRQPTKTKELPDDLEPPAGTWQALDDYRSIHNDLPRVYGIGPEGLPESADAQRQAQARQLKAYLLFFDQLLADYLAQLAHLRKLFSLEQNLERTRASAPLHERPELEELFRREFLETASPAEELSEDAQTRVERRNRFLDHLLARFNERFADYAAIMATLERGAMTGDGLVRDKLAFLQDYPRLSRERSRGFDRGKAGNPWGSDDVSGLERRLCGLLGIRRCERRSLVAAEAEFPQDSRQQEGMHLVEHILLRPRSESDGLLEVALDPDCEPYPEDVDPYSFRATLVLPSWPERFSNMDFRAFLEQTARLEAPAHVHLRICWVDSGQMGRFEDAFASWLRERKQEALLGALKSLRSVYPEAILREPRADMKAKPLVLGRNQLGPLPKPE